LTGYGLGVLDLDTKKAPEHSSGGYATLIDVEEALEVDLSHLPLVRSFSGAHLYFRYEGVLRTLNPWLPYLDVQADGGHQVAAPGTIREVRGVTRVYTLARGSLDEIPYAPVELVEAIRRSSVHAQREGRGRTGNSTIPPTAYLREKGFRLGERDNGFNALAWRLVRNHYPHMDLVRQLAYEVWLESDNPVADPLPWAKVEDQIVRAEKAIGPDVEAQIAWAARIRGAK